MTNANALPPSKRPALIWGVVCLILAGALLALLPQAGSTAACWRCCPNRRSARSPALNDGFMQRLDRQLVWLVSPGKQADLQVVSRLAAVAANLRRAGRGQRPNGCRQSGLGTFFLATSQCVNRPATRARLQEGGEAQAQWILSQLYSAFSGVSGKELQNDPLMLMRGSQLAMANSGQRMQLQDGWLTSKKTRKAMSGICCTASWRVRRSICDRRTALVTTLAQLEKELKARHPQAQLLSRGTVFYSDYASQQAKRDISTRRGHPVRRHPVDRGSVRLAASAAVMRDLYRYRRTGRHRCHAAVVWRAASDDHW